MGTMEDLKEAVAEEQQLRRRKEKVLYADVSRAYFYARAQRPVYVNSHRGRPKAR